MVFAHSRQRTLSHDSVVRWKDLYVRLRHPKFVNAPFPLEMRRSALDRHIILFQLYLEPLTRRRTVEWWPSTAEASNHDKNQLGPILRCARCPNLVSDKVTFVFLVGLGAKSGLVVRPQPPRQGLFRRSTMAAELVKGSISSTKSMRTSTRSCTMRATTSCMT